MPTAAAAPGQDRERHSMQPRRPAAHHGITTLASKSNPQATRRAASLKGARARGSCCRRSRSRSRAGRARLGELEAQKAASQRLGVRRRARPLGLAVWSPAGRGCHGAPARQSESYTPYSNGKSLSLWWFRVTVALSKAHS